MIGGVTSPQWIRFGMEGRRVGAEQNGDGVLALRALQPDVRRLRSRRFSCAWA